MQIQIEWQSPILLAKHWKLKYKNPIFPEVGELAGVYFFSRKHGTSFEPFYIGETYNLRLRLKQHLETVRITDVLRGHNENIKQGQKYFHYGYFYGKQAQNTKKCLKIVQKFLIEKALAENLLLLNSKLTAWPTHQLDFHGNQIARGIYPDRTTVRKS